MKKICFIGNSHIAALKLGSDQMDNPLAKQFELTFFGAMGVFFNKTTLKFKEGNLFSNHTHIKRYFKALSNGKESITIADYDCFVLVGLGVSLLEYVNLYGAFASSEKTNRQTVLQLISAACFNHAEKNILQNSPCLYLYTLLKKTTKKPIYLIPAPFPGVRMNTVKREWKEVASHKNLIAFQKRYYQDIRLNFRDSEILYLPKEVLETPINTKTKFTKDTFYLNLKNKYKPGHALHMNADYGEIILNTLLQQIQSVSL